MTFDIGSFMSGLGGVVSGGVVAGLYLRGLREEVAMLRQAVQNLRDNHVAGMEKRLDAIENGCVVKHDRLNDSLRSLERLTESIRNLGGWLNKVDGKLERISESTAAFKADIEAKELWLKNLDAAHQRHVADREIHHG